MSALMPDKGLPFPLLCRAANSATGRHPDRSQRLAKSSTRPIGADHHTLQLDTVSGFTLRHLCCLLACQPCPAAELLV